MSERPNDLYAILGVPRDATTSEISRAYRILLRRYHPDTRDSGEARLSSDAALQQLLGAYAVLRDTERRAAYDRQTSPRTSIGARPTRNATVARVRSQMDRPIRAGPVHWEPA
jgi:DnaJ-class molecular chaperone